MACLDLGLWAYNSTDPNGLCNETPTINLYGDSIFIGNSMFSGNTCDTLSDYTSPGFFSNGIVLIETQLDTSTIVNISACSSSEIIYCVQNEPGFNGEYYLFGAENGYPLYSSITNNTCIYYSTVESRWCLSTDVSSPCIQFGPFGSTSPIPDFDNTVAYEGLCVTTTTTTDPCLTFDFSAVFDCLVPTTTTTTTAAPTTTTTTTIPPNPCSATSITVSAFTYTTTTTTAAPTTTTTTTIVYPCNFSGEAIFNSFTEVIQCANSKRFSDCFTGIDYYTSDLVLISGNTPLENYVYLAEINGQQTCVTFEGLFENISGVDDVTLLNEIGSRIDGSCLTCFSNIQPTTTTTTSTSTTTTTTKSPCISLSYRISNINPVSYMHPNDINVTTTSCEGVVVTNSVSAGNNSIFCSTTYPVSDNPQNTIITVLPGTC
jgi:hypothetical protein